MVSGAEANLLVESLARAEPRQDAFVRELLADLGRRHPGVLGPAPNAPPAAVFAAFQRFARTAAGEATPGGDDAGDPIDLADSAMKVFARVLGRAAWTPAMALAWNAALRARGAVLLEELRAISR